MEPPPVGVQALACFRSLKAVLPRTRTHSLRLGLVLRPHSVATRFLSMANARPVFTGKPWASAQRLILEPNCHNALVGHCIGHEIDAHPQGLGEGNSAQTGEAAQLLTLQGHADLLHDGLELLRNAMHTVTKATTSESPLALDADLPRVLQVLVLE